MNELGFRRRLWEILNPSAKWSGEVDSSKEELLASVASKVFIALTAHEKLGAAKRDLVSKENTLRDIGDVLWGDEEAPDQPGRAGAFYIAEIRRLQALSTGAKKKTKKYGDELLEALNHAGELDEEVQDIEVELRKLSENVGANVPIDTDGEPIRGKRWVRREMISNLHMWMGGLLSRVKRAEVAQQIWNDMFSQMRDVAVNYAPVVAHCQSAEHVYELCRDPDRFRLEVDRRIHRPDEAIEIQRSPSHIYTTDAEERKRNSK